MATKHLMVIGDAKRIADEITALDFKTLIKFTPIVEYASKVAGFPIQNVEHAIISLRNRVICYLANFTGDLEGMLDKIGRDDLMEIIKTTMDEHDDDDGDPLGTLLLISVDSKIYVPEIAVKIDDWLSAKVQLASEGFPNQYKQAEALLTVAGGKQKKLSTGIMAMLQPVEPGRWTHASIFPGTGWDSGVRPLVVYTHGMSSVNNATSFTVYTRKDDVRPGLKVVK